MLKKLFVLILLTFTSNVFSHQVTCSNFDQEELKLLKNTDWIPVPWNNGSCYFHNVKTKEDLSVFESE